MLERYVVDATFSEDTDGWFVGTAVTPGGTVVGHGNSRFEAIEKVRDAAASLMSKSRDQITIRPTWLRSSGQ